MVITHEDNTTSPHDTSSSRISPHDTSDRTDRTPSSDIGDYDAAARRKALALGLELADYSIGGQGNSADAGNAHEEEEVAIKMEEDVDG